MDVCESEKAVGKQSTTVTLRPPLVSAENKNETTRRSRTREVSSRYMSSAPLAASVPKRCPSPNGRRSPSTSTALSPKRAISAERKRFSSPSTPVQDVAASMVVTPRKAETLWPSTMRSLSLSFQSDASAVPVGKKEKNNSRPPSDRTLKPSSNVSCKAESPTARKLTPEKRRSPLKGKNSADQLENSKPVDSLRPGRLDQHQLPSRMKGRTPSFPNRSDISEKLNKTSSSHSRRLSPDATAKPVQKSASYLLIFTSLVETGKEACSPKLQRPSSPSSSEIPSATNAAARTQSLPIPRSRPSSPSISRGASPSQGRVVIPSYRGNSSARVRPSSPSGQPQDTTSVPSFISDIRKKKAASDIESGKEVNSPKLQRPSSSSSAEIPSVMNAAARTQSLPIPRSRPSSPLISRGASPSRGRIVIPSSRGNSPAKIRPSSPSGQPQDTTSVLSFIADIRKKKAASDIEDVHRLRLLYNRHLQWRYSNARSGAAMRLQKAKAEKTLYNIWSIILDLTDSVRKKRSDLQQLKLKLKLYSILGNQARILDEWASIERDHTNSLNRAIQDLQAITLRIPVTEGARGDIASVNGAVCSAVGVMKAMASSLYSILPHVEGMNSLVSELADVAARERAMLKECESLFGSIAALQVEEDSLRSHVLLKKEDHPPCVGIY